jgi:hypothetical protein
MRTVYHACSSAKYEKIRKKGRFTKIISLKLDYIVNEDYLE